MRPCVDVILNDKVGRIEVLDDEVPPLLSTDEFAPPRLSDNLSQLPKWELLMNQCDILGHFSG